MIDSVSEMYNSKTDGNSLSVKCSENRLYFSRMAEQNKPLKIPMIIHRVIFKWKGDAFG